MTKSYAGHMRFLIHKAHDKKEQAKNRKEKTEHKINPRTLMATTIYCMQTPQIILPLSLLLGVVVPAAAQESCKTFTCSISSPSKGSMAKPGQQNNIVVFCETGTNRGPLCTGDFELDCQFSSGNGNNPLGPNTNVSTFFAAGSGASCLIGCGRTQQATATIYARTEKSNDEYRYFPLTFKNDGDTTMAARCAVVNEDASRSSYKKA